MFRWLFGGRRNYISRREFEAYVQHVQRAFRLVYKEQQAMAADFSRLNTAVANLSKKVDDFLAANPDVQPQIDAAADAVDAVAAKIPATTAPTP